MCDDFVVLCYVGFDVVMSCFFFCGGVGGIVVRYRFAFIFVRVRRYFEFIFRGFIDGGVFFVLVFVIDCFEFVFECECFNFVILMC